MTLKKRKNPHAVALGRKGGIATSAAKRAAVRRNGALGGRPASTDIMTGIKRRGSGWQATVRVGRRVVSMQFTLDTPIPFMQSWRTAIRTAVQGRTAKGER